MANIYCKVEISAENTAQADKILTVLLAKKLITSGQVLAAPARFLWKGQIVDMDYVTIYSFTLEKYKQAVISEVKNASVEEVPMISFVQIDGNLEFFHWIEETLGSDD